MSSIQFDASQELRVTNLRLQQAIEKAVREFERQESTFLHEQPAAFSVSSLELKAPKLLEFEKPKLPLEQYGTLRSHYKNAKRFFEKNEKKEVQNALETKMKSDLESQFEVEKTRLKNWTDALFSEIMERLKLRFLQSTVATLQTERDLLEQQQTLAMWKEKRKLL